MRCFNPTLALAIGCVCTPALSQSTQGYRIVHPPGNFGSNYDSPVSQEAIPSVQRSGMGPTRTSLDSILNVGRCVIGRDAANSDALRIAYRTGQPSGPWLDRLKPAFTACERLNRVGYLERRHRLAAIGDALRERDSGNG